MEKNLLINEKNVGRMVESIIGCKWSISVLRMLNNGIHRPGAMQRQVDGLTTKVLNERLVKLSRFGIIEKTVYPEVPPRVEYCLTEFGERFIKIIDLVDDLQTHVDRREDSV